MASLPQNPLAIVVAQVDGKSSIVVYSQFKHLSIIKSIFAGGHWAPDQQPITAGARPGAWVYPAGPEVAAKIYAAFAHSLKMEKGSLVDTEFMNLAGMGADSLKIKITVDDGRIWVRSQYALLDVVKQIPGPRQFDNTRKMWSWPLSSLQAKYIKETFSMQAPNDWADALLDETFTDLVAQQATDLPDIDSATTPWAHQKETFWRAFNHDSYGIFLEMGCGKTKVATDLMVNKGFKKTLIITVKKAVDSVWPGEIALHAARPINVLQLNVNKTAAQKAEMLKQFLSEFKNSQAAVVMNYELTWQPAMAKVLTGINWDCIICDESQKIKTPGGKTSKFISVLGKRAAHRYLLTGTPMGGSPLDIYAQYRFMAPEIFGTSFASFRNRYCITDDYNRPIQFINQDEMNRKIYSKAYRVRSADVLDLPEKLIINKNFDLSTKGAKAYGELKQELTAKFEMGETSVNNTLTQLLRLQQLTSGYLPITDADGLIAGHERVDTGKQELLEELLAGVDDAEPFVIFARFSKDLDTIHETAAALGRESCELSGRRNDLMKWQKGGAPILAVQIQAGGAGINLTRAHYCAYYSIGYISPADYEQSLFRVWRPGQKHPTTIYHLIANNTVDTQVMWSLENKRNIIEDILTRHLGIKRLAERLGA
jgi:SNF2 family DNA or RNA helicase